MFLWKALIFKYWKWLIKIENVLFFSKFEMLLNLFPSFEIINVSNKFRNSNVASSAEELKEI